MNDQATDRLTATEGQLVPGWYPIAPSSGVVRKKPLGVKRLGRDLVLWRADNGRVVCFPDRCTHRSATLSPGKIRNGCLECPYHGLRFDAGGRCVLIPANGVGAPVPKGFDLQSINVRDEHGIVWYWHGEGEPAQEVPWIPGATEQGDGVSEYNYVLSAPYLRIVENLLDFHHFPILHKTMLPGIGTRMDDMDAHVEDKVVVFGATMRYEQPGLLRRDTPIKAKFMLPSIALIEFGGFYINYFLSPVDDARCWLFARYRALKFGGWLSAALGKFSGRYDRAIFMLQDRHVLLSQSDRAGDFSHFKLYPADRALALFWGLRKQAILDAARHASATSDATSAAAG